MKIKHYSDLIAYQKGYALALNIYDITKKFPSEEKFGLVSQLRRASVSIPSNIAEGFSRGNKEYIQFLRIALGSISEIETQIRICRDVGLIKHEVFDGLFKLTIDVRRLLLAYLKKLNPF